MSSDLPSLLEDHISQIPALQLLQNLGWQYLTPAEAVALRGGKLGGVLFKMVLDEHWKSRLMQKLLTRHVSDRIHKGDA